MKAPKVDIALRLNIYCGISRSFNAPISSFSVFVCWQVQAFVGVLQHLLRA